MDRALSLASHRGTAATLAFVVALVVLGAGAVGCTEPKTSGTTSTKKPASTESTATGSGTATGTAKATDSKVPPTVREFAASMKGVRIYYPTKLPAGWAYELAEVFPKGADGGPTIDIAFIKGETELWITQGSPVMRDYEIISLGKVPFGSATADIMWDDPEAQDGVQFIVYVEKGNLVEIYGDATIAEMKELAAAMAVVK